MTTQTDALWEINNEYRKRLSMLMGHMKLLEQMLMMRNNAEPALRATIRFIRSTLEDIDADLHEWRHKYFYVHPGDDGKRRMVSEADNVMHAIKTFIAMLEGHLQQFDSIQAIMAEQHRPNPEYTRVIKGGDLWDMCQYDIDALLRYDQFVNDQLTDMLSL
jgi:hypothetical protein